MEKVRFAVLPCAWIQVGRFSGSNKARLIDSTEVRSFARKHLTVESVIEGVGRQERWFIPIVAIRLGRTGWQKLYAKRCVGPGRARRLFESPTPPAAAGNPVTCILEAVMGV